MSENIAQIQIELYYQEMECTKDIQHQFKIMREVTGKVGGPDGVVPLPLIELCGHRDDSFLDGHAQLSLGHLPHLQQQPGADELWAYGEGTVGGDQELCTSIIVNHLEEGQ